jgi:hypothetical protein
MYLCTLGSRLSGCCSYLGTCAHPSDSTFPIPITAQKRSDKSKSACSCMRADKKELTPPLWVISGGPPQQSTHMPTRASQNRSVPAPIRKLVGTGGPSSSSPLVNTMGPLNDGTAGTPLSRPIHGHRMRMQHVQMFGCGCATVWKRCPPAAARHLRAALAKCGANYPPSLTSARP